MHNLCVYDIDCMSVFPHRAVVSEVHNLYKHALPSMRLNTNLHSADRFLLTMHAVVLAAGSVTVTTTALVHGGSTNVDDSPRYSMHLTFAAVRPVLHFGFRF